jgi:hypothetical protein
MPLHTHNPSGPDIKVVIRNALGKYLAQDDNGLFFTSNRADAIILNYRADQVEKQLAIIREQQGIALAADPVPPAEIYETCDGCKEFFMPFMMYFDGKRFLCAECRERFSRRPVRP